MSLDIRAALPTDARVLPLVEKDAGQIFRFEEGLEWLANQDGGTVESYLPLIQAQTVWVAEAANEICGFLAARIEKPDLHIVEVSVCRKRQRQGVARALIERAAEEARQLRLEALTLTTFRDLPWNAPYYARLGFEKVQEASLSERLKAQLEIEAAAGLPRSRRCAMQLHL